MISLAVYYEGPFWVGVLEMVEGDELRVTRFVLGAEPTDPELYEFLMRHGGALLARTAESPSVPAGERAERRVNPKRAAKLAARQAARVSTRSTASQEAMRIELEGRKREAATDRRERKRELAEYRREVARRKRVERHRDT